MFLLSFLNLISSLYLPIVFGHGQGLLYSLTPYYIIIKNFTRLSLIETSGYVVFQLLKLLVVLHYRSFLASGAVLTPTQPSIMDKSSSKCVADGRSFSLYLPFQAKSHVSHHRRGILLK